MPTTREVSDAYADVLLPVLAPGPGVCGTCRSVADPKYQLCWRCRSAAVTLAGRRADAVAPISYAVKGGQLANELWRYKGSAIIDRQHYVLGFTAMLWRFLTEHEACLAVATGAPDFTLVTTVPSTKWRAGEHPLADIVGRRIPGTSRRYLPCLEPNPLVAQERVLNAQRFRVAGDTTVRGRMSSSWTTRGRAAVTPSLRRPR